MPTEQPDGNITRFEGFQGYPMCMLQKRSSSAWWPTRGRRIWGVQNAPKIVTKIKQFSDIPRNLVFCE